MKESTFEKYYKNLSDLKLHELSQCPEKLNVNGLTYLIQELELRGLQEACKRVVDFYSSTDLSKYGHLKLNIWLKILFVGLILSSGLSLYLLSVIVYHSSLGDYSITFIIGHLIHIIINIGLMNLMLTYQKQFPIFMISKLVIVILLLFGIVFYVHEFSFIIVCNIISCLIWISYLSQSKSVKTTFIR